MITNDARQIVSDMCDNINLFNNISSTYIQTLGPDLVITEQSEAMLKNILSEIEQSVSTLRDESYVSQYEENSRHQFIEWLDEIGAFVDVNRKIIERSKDFTWLQNHILGGLA